MTILTDPIRPFDPSRRTETSRPGSERDDDRGDRSDGDIERRTFPGPARLVPPAAPGDAVRAAMRPRGPRRKTTFELASRGGYRRTVTGTIAYLDDEAATYLVLAEGELLRVPIRDITSSHDEILAGDIPSSGDIEGLGTG